MTALPPPSDKGRLAGLWGALVGAGVGFGIGAVGYALIVPILEASTGLVRELQGFAWNLVPGSLVVGAVVGLLIGLAWRRRVRRRAAQSARDA